MSIKLVFRNANENEAKFVRNINGINTRLSQSMLKAAKDSAAEILQRGQADIQSAGKFGPAWTAGLHADVVQRGPRSFTVVVRHDIAFFSIFEKGGVVTGHPWLWIPLSFAGNIGKVSNFPGRLIMVQPKSGSRPLLISGDDHQPKYVGVSSVTIARKFHLGDIIKDVGDKIAGRIADNMKVK